MSNVKEWKTPIIIALALMLVTAFIIILMRKPKFDLYTAKSSKKKKRSRKKKKKSRKKGKKRK